MIYLTITKKVEEVIRRLDQAGLRLDINTYAFATFEVKYFGFVTKAGEGVTVDPIKVEAIKNRKSQLQYLKPDLLLDSPIFTESLYRSFVMLSYVVW